VCSQGSPADMEPRMAQGQIVVSIDGEDMAGKGVQEVVEALHVRSLPSNAFNTPVLILRCMADCITVNDVGLLAIAARGPTNECGPEAGIFGAAARRLPGPHAQTGQEREKEEEREEMSVMKSLVIDSLHTTDVLQRKQ
jgi:hypothetical protein